MIRVRPVLLAVLVCSAAVGVGRSQPPERREARPAEGEPERPAAGPAFRVLPPFAQRELRLSDEQQKQVEALETDVQAKMEKILTSEQLKQWNDRRAARGPRGEATPGTSRPTGDNDSRRPRTGRGSDERRTDERRSDERRDGARGDRADGPLHRVVGQLHLTPEQQTKVDAALNEHREKVRSLFREAQRDLVSRMKAVLTDEQFQQFTKALENGPPGSRRRDRSDDAPRSEKQPVQP